MCHDREDLSSRFFHLFTTYQTITGVHCCIRMCTANMHTCVHTTDMHRHTYNIMMMVEYNPFLQRKWRARNSTNLLYILWSPLSVSHPTAFMPAISCALFLFVQFPKCILSSSATWLYIFVGHQEKNGPWHCIFLHKLQRWTDFAWYIFMLCITHCRCNCDKLEGQIFIVGICVF